MSTMSLANSSLCIAAALMILSAANARAQTPAIPEQPPTAPTPKEPAPTAPVESPPPPRASTTPPAERPSTASSIGVEATRPQEPPALKAGRLAASPSGETGLIRVHAADSTRPRLIRLSLGFDYFSVGSFFTDNDSHTSFGGTLAISGSPINYVELWLNTRVQSNNNSRTTPQLLQTQGDLTLGAKGFYPVTKLLTTGLDVQATFLSGIGQTTFGASQFRVRGLLTGDFQKTSNLPIRGHLNLGVLFDGSNKLASGNLSNAERYALGVGDYTRLGIGAGVEVPLKYVTPFLEYTIDVPLGYKATPGVVLESAALRRTALRAEQTLAACDPTTDATDAFCGRPSASRAIPQRITPGIRVTAIPDLTLDFAVEIGVTPDKATGVIATPPYNLVFLASYPIDPFREDVERGPPIAVPVLVPELKEMAPHGSVTGVVKSKDGPSISGAVITFDRAPPVATSADGRFKSFDLEPGPIAITVTHEGFEPASAQADVAEGEPVDLEIKLVPAQKEGIIRGRVADDKDKPIDKAPIEISGPTEAKATTGPDGTFEVKVAAGKYTIAAAPDGYLTKARDVEIKGGETVVPDIIVRKRPKKPIVEVSRDLIVVRESVHFVTNEARLAPDAAAVLDNVVDLLVTHKQIKKVRVEGHTDNVGSDAANLQLSKDRANAVVQYLVQQGVDPTRLTSEGFGASRPVAPNLTRRGREQNRRVEFHILEQ